MPLTAMPLYVKALQLPDCRVTKALHLSQQTLALDRRSGVVEGVRVLGRLALQLARIAQGARTAVAEKPAPELGPLL